MSERERTLRFRRSGYRDYDTEPKWHIAARAYDPKEMYKAVLALCGYEVRAWTLDWSRAIRRPKGVHCTKCIEAAERG